MSSAPATVILQTLCLPDAAITDQRALFLRAGPGVQHSAGGLLLQTGAVVAFDTWVNLFDLDRWHGACALAGLRLRLRGEGGVRLVLHRLTAAQPEPRGADPATGPAPQAELLHSAELMLAGEVVVDLGDLAAGGGLLAVTLEALMPLRLESGAFTAETRKPPPRLAIAITTFRRETAVALTTRRIAGFFDTDAAGQVIARNARLFVVDNGDSAVLPPHPKVERIANRNLGGAGGFARGLAAASDGGFSHCLFMDDDASFQMENLIRTHAFLWLARDPAQAVAGAMISAGRPWAIWENGAVFDRFCRPCEHGTDLRDRDAVARMIFRTHLPVPRGFYGGWWFFAFPLAQVRRWPFPFFVRGDDISFSLANPFRIAVLNGVVSFQEDFAAKESPQTLYLDLRNHLHHHLTQDGMQISPAASAGIALRFILRSLARMHYDSAAAQLLAWEDVLSGPEHFIANADMTERRQRVAAMLRDEVWQPLAADAGSAPLRRKPPSRPVTLLAKLSLNGHLVPFWGWIGRRVRVDISDRGLLWPVWGARAAQYCDPVGGRGYSVRHDKRRFAALLWQALRLRRRWMRAGPALAASYRAAYPQIAARAFWDEQFAAGAPAREP